jgi:hypothetical protein
MAKKVNENWGALGKAALKAASPMLKKNGKKMFNKAAKGAIKKFGKNATRQIVNGAKQLAQDPEVQQAALEMGKKGLSALKNKFMSKPAQQQMLPDEEAVLQQQQMQAAQQPQLVQQPQQVQQPVRRKAQQPAQPTQEQLIENWSKIVDKALNEAWGAALKGATTAGKALLKGAKAAEEMADAKGLTVLGASPARLIPTPLTAPDTGEVDHHALVMVEKCEKTPKIYPRKYAQIVKKPL